LLQNLEVAMDIRATIGIAALTASVVFSSVVAVDAQALPPKPVPRAPSTTQPQVPDLPDIAETTPEPEARSFVITFANQTGQTVDYFYLDEAGEAQYMATLGPGDAVEQPSEPGVEFVFAVNSQEIAAYVAADFDGQQYDITFAATDPAPPAPPAPPPVPAPPGPSIAYPDLGYDGLVADCSRPPRVSADDAVCSDVNAAGLDIALAQTLAALRSRLSPSAYDQLASDQLDWMEMRVRCAGLTACLSRIYARRIDEIGRTPDAVPTSQGQGFPAPGVSAGGIIRGGPGMDFNRVGSLGQGERITVLALTAAPYMNGYGWFKIEWSGGTGYQWGGLLCPFNGYIEGAYDAGKCN
jgi:hypothetical protein